VPHLVKKSWISLQNKKKNRIKTRIWLGFVISVEHHGSLLAGMQFMAMGKELCFLGWYQGTLT